MSACYNHILESRDRRWVSWLSIISISVVLFAAKTPVQGQEKDAEIKRILVTFDQSGSMVNFSHNRLHEYATKILFDGISKSDLKPGDKWAFVADISESLFASPLYKPGCQTEIYKFAQSMKRINIPVLTRNNFIKKSRVSRSDCKWRTDIASVVEYACRYSERDLEDQGRTFWIFVSDDKPVSTLQKGEQAKRLRALELVYEWDTLMRITVGDYADPPLVEIREVYNRKYRKVLELIERAQSAGPKELAEIIKELDEFIRTIPDLIRQLRDANLKEVLANFEQRIKELTTQAKEEIYKTKLGLFGLAQPGTTDEESRFVEGDSVRFSWVKPDCEGVTHYVLKVRDRNNKRLIINKRSNENEQIMTELKSGNYEWTVVAHGKGGLFAESFVTRAQNKWRPFRIAKPLGPFQLSSPENGAKVFAGGVSFKWTVSDNAIDYLLEIIPPQGSPITNMRKVCYASEDCLQVGEYTWSITTMGPGGFPSLKSNTWSFTVDLPINPPNLLSPNAIEEHFEGDTITFEWTPVKEAGSYAFKLLHPDGTIETKVGLQKPEVSLQCSKGGVYQWQAASVKGKQEKWSKELRQLNVKYLIPPAPNLLDPAPAAYVFSEQVTFKWESAENADEYELSVKTETGEVVRNVPTTSTQQPFTLPRFGDYQWTVTSLNSKSGQRSQAKEVRILKYRELPQPFNLLAPPDSPKRRRWGPVGFSWEQSKNAIGYRFVLQHKASGNKIEKSCSDEKTIIPFETEGEGEYTWTVYALAEDGKQEVEADNGEWRFDIRRGIPPEPLRPFDDTTLPTGIIKFRWTEAREANVKSYNLHIYKSLPEQTDEVFQEIREIDATVKIYDVNLPPGDYAWTVSALCDQDMVLECETKSRFKVKEGFGCCWYVIIVLFIVAIGGAVGWWFWKQSIDVELRRSDLPHGQTSSFELGLSGASQSRIYLAEVEGQEDAQVLDIGAKGYYIERDFFGLSLCGPEGKIQKVRFSEEFNVPLSEGSDAVLTVTKLSKTGSSEDEDMIDRIDLLDDMSGADDSNGVDFDDEY